MGKGKVIISQFVTVDGVVEGPDRWAFRFGPKRVAGDDFKLGSILDTGVLLLGHRTWEVFSHRWPNRSDGFARVMNRIRKVVVSRSAPALDAWSNSSLLEGELVAGVADLRRDQDVVVFGSTSVVHALAAADAVDEYRLLVIPTALGVGERLFVAPVDLQLRSIEKVGEAVLARYDRAARA
ncbi:MAG: riboflavin biosynthesis protein RibD [Chloroflexi bacterium]|nr:MAG: riboflavin biosynthesis protein RibD [Chloroflexota bacterium]